MIDPEITREEDLRRMWFEFSEINRRIKQQLRNLNLPPEERASIRDDYVELIRRRMSQMAQYAGESRVHPNLRCETVQ